MPSSNIAWRLLPVWGAVAVDMDIVAWGESEEQLGIETHQAPYAQQIQTLWSKVVTDWIWLPTTI